MIEKNKWRIFSGLICLCYILGVIGIMSDPFEWEYAFAYGYWIIWVLFIAMGWGSFLIIEMATRKNLKTCTRRAPHYAILAAVMLPCLAFVGSLMRPLALSIPSCCTFTQSVEWTTSYMKPGKGRIPPFNGPHKFYVSPFYKGNPSQYSVQSVNLYWTGPEDEAELSIAGFHPLKFTFEDEHEAPITVNGTLEALYNRMARSGLHEEELRPITRDVMHTLIQIQSGDPPRPAHDKSRVYEPHVMTNDWEYLFGTAVWIIVFAILFNRCYNRGLRPNTMVNIHGDPPAPSNAKY